MDSQKTTKQPKRPCRGDRLLFLLDLIESSDLSKAAQRHLEERFGKDMRDILATATNNGYVLDSPLREVLAASPAIADCVLDIAPLIECLESDLTDEHAAAFRRIVGAVATGELTPKDVGLDR